MNTRQKEKLTMEIVNACTGLFRKYGKSDGSDACQCMEAMGAAYLRIDFTVHYTYGESDDEAMVSVINELVTMRDATINYYNSKKGGRK